MAATLDFYDTWDRAAVEVISPNEQITITISGDRSITVAILPGYYERASRSQLVDQLTRTARLALVRRTKAFFDLRSRECGRVMAPGRAIVNEEAAEYDRRRAELEVRGASADDAVSIWSVGLVQFGFHLAPTVSELDAAAFAQRVGEAATQMLRDHVVKVGELKREVYRADWETT